MFRGALSKHAHRLLSFAMVLGLIGIGSALGQQTRRPNILWIIGDDQAPYVIGAYGNRQVRTPNLDRLASQGMRFDRAFCNSPVCTASRQSFLTGRYPRTIGVTQLQTALPESELTLATVLRTNGYDTAAIGKMHFNSQLKHGFDLRIDHEQHRQWLSAKGKTPLPREVEVQPPWKPFRDPASIWLNSACRPFGSVDAEMEGTWFVQQAVQFIQQPRENPFFLIVSFYEPHSPFNFPIEFRDRHSPREFQAPQPGPEDDWQVPEVFRSLTDREKQGIISAYYTSTEFLDRNVGRVLDALEKSGHARDTLVVFLGDHGYLLGQHGRFEKHCGYEEAVRSALLVRYPPKVKPRQSTAALVEFIDIYPTVLDLIGSPTPASVQGKSLVPLLTGSTRFHRDQVFIEYAENEEAYIRTDHWKFIYGTGQRARKDGYAITSTPPRPTIQLYDLDKDPREQTNVARLPAHASLIAKFKGQLADHLKRTARRPELVPATTDVDAVLQMCLRPADQNSGQ
jgi:choline-sulfatase